MVVEPCRPNPEHERKRGNMGELSAETVEVEGAGGRLVLNREQPAQSAIDEIREVIYRELGDMVNRDYLIDAIANELQGTLAAREAAAAARALREAADDYGDRYRVAHDGLAPVADWLRARAAAAAAGGGA